MADRLKDNPATAYAIIIALSISLVPVAIFLTTGSTTYDVEIQESTFRAGSEYRNGEIVSGFENSEIITPVYQVDREKITEVTYQYRGEFPATLEIENSPDNFVTGSGQETITIRENSTSTELDYSLDGRYIRFRVIMPENSSISSLGFKASDPLL